MHPFSRSASIVALACAGFTVQQAHADLINIQGNGAASAEHLGSFTGTLNYTPLTSDTATIVLTLTNTTAAATGGFITGVGLLHNDNFAGVTVTLTATTNSYFVNLVGPVGVSPFGNDRGGAAGGGSWTGGGSPNAGTGVGQSVTLTFSLSGTNIGVGHSAADFVGLHNSHQDLVVRFRGMEGGGSDKVPGIGVTVSPTPGAGALLGLGGVMAFRRRR